MEKPGQSPGLFDAMRSYSISNAAIKTIPQDLIIRRPYPAERRIRQMIVEENEKEGHPGISKIKRRGSTSPFYF